MLKIKILLKLDQGQAHLPNEILKKKTKNPLLIEKDKNLYDILV